jgi:hypothetical protein
MLELISIHIPKTAGTTFHAILRQVYGQEVVSPAYRRRDITPHLVDGKFSQGLPYGLQVLHGHFYFKELQGLQHQTGAKVICWVRDPIQRVISNYRFFIAGLDNPDRNPRQYELNKHRKGESLLTYAERSENRNRMSDFIEGINLEDIFFCGVMEQFEQEVHRLGQMLGWPTFAISILNQGASMNKDGEIPLAVLQQIEIWNAADIALYDHIIQSQDR